MLCNSWVPCSRDYSKLRLTFHEQKDENWKIWLSFSTLVLTNEVLRIRKKCWWDLQRDRRNEVVHSCNALKCAANKSSASVFDTVMSAFVSVFVVCVILSLPWVFLRRSYEIHLRFTSDRQNFEESGEIKYLFYRDHSLVVGGGHYCDQRVYLRYCIQNYVWRIWRHFLKLYLKTLVGKNIVSGLFWWMSLFKILHNKMFVENLKKLWKLYLKTLVGGKNYL